MNGLSLRNIESGYGAKTVIRGITLALASKETLVLMGSSGSGKTTLLLTILGILRPTHGSIHLNGDDITSIPIEERNIGYLPQDYGLFPHLNIMDNIAYGLTVRGYPREERETIASTLLKLVDLEGCEKKRTQELSGGQKQRVALARALAINPKLLLLDEPLSNIDQITKLDVAVQLKKLFTKLDIPIILVTHNHEDALMLSEKLAIMIDGKIAQMGDLRAVLKSPKTAFIKRLLMPFTVEKLLRMR